MRDCRDDFIVLIVILPITITSKKKRVQGKQAK